MRRLNARPAAARAGVILRRQVRDTALNVVVGSPLVPRAARPALLRRCGLDVGRVTINAGHFFGGRQVRIGDGTFINYGVFVDNADQVTIGRRVSFGPQVLVLTGSHDLGDHDRRAGTPRSAPVRIEDGAWIGARAVILPGVTVGAGAVVAAGAVVTEDVPPDTLVAGVPAVERRRLDPS